MKTLFVAILGFSFLAAGCGDPENEIKIANDPNEMLLAGISTESLSEAEMNAILFMREEEKLARDIYVYLYNKWSVRSFNNISMSEQTHMDAVLSLIKRYDLEDPAVENIYEKFENQDLQSLYTDLAEAGASGLEDALRVGAAIEEIDIIDLQRELNENVDNADIIIVFENLMKGSRNHLRTFVSNLSMIEVSYDPKYLTQEVYDEIINTSRETGPG